jgi:hypothetical protein
MAASGLRRQPRPVQRGDAVGVEPGHAPRKP